MEKQNDKLPPIPLKRYFSVGELCYLANVSIDMFTDWQVQNSFVLGNGGSLYSRQDVLLLRKVRNSFEPEVDPFSEGGTGEDGTEVLTAIKVREDLSVILSKLDGLLAKG